MTRAEMEAKLRELIDQGRYYPPHVKPSAKEAAERWAKRNESPANS